MRLPLCVNKQVQRLQHTMEATNFMFIYSHFLCTTTRTAHKKRQVRSEN
jgi:hypothetical protein